MAGYQPYPEYKDSGVEWLGEVPRHWRIKKLKFVAVVQPSNVDKKTEDNEEPVLLCNYTDVYKNEFIDSSFEFMKATATKAEIEKFSVDAGDVIVTKDSESPDDIAVPAYVIEKVDGLVCGYHLTQIKGMDIDGKYLFRLFQSLRFSAQFVVAANGVTRFGLPQYAISNAFTSIPPEEEQQTIARFLDNKTAQIDALIAKKQILLEKLAEKRTALISHAVTKGLDPNVKMKDSGVEWLGEVPEHWGIKKLKFVAVVQPSNVDKKTEDNEEPVLLCNYTDVYKNEFIDSSFEFMKATATKAEIEKFSVDAGDVIVTKDSESPDDIAVPAYVIEKVDGLVCGYHLTQIKGMDIDGKYLFRLFQSLRFSAQFVVAANGVTRFGLPQYAITNAFVSLPPIFEQKDIVAYIDEQNEKIDQLIISAEFTIKKLKEYRSALITQAVTGKIDVRHVKIPQATAKGQAA